MTISLEAVREFLPIVVLLGIVPWGLRTQRRRLRPWHLWLPATGAMVSVPTTMWLVTAARSGPFSGWGGLGLVLVLLPAAVVAALRVTALPTLAVRLLIALLLLKFGSFRP